MPDNNDKIAELLGKLEILLTKQEIFSREINDLKIEIRRLNFINPVPKPEEGSQVKPRSENITEVNLEEKVEILRPINLQPVIKAAPYKPQLPPKPPKVKSDIEKFIGENLINKIGIAITIIGVAIGAKYSIDHNLISPLTRIILGYLVGIGLLGFGMKLKKNYENFSAVLVSGAMAIMYFLTYFAYSVYGLIPQVPTFLIMVIFTAFTVFAAINYNKQVIAHIGLVGAYAVPFLLSSGSGKVEILFSYMAIINIGILILSFKKYWKALYYSSFALTWLIFFSWYLTEYKIAEHFTIALTFLTVFFVVFYISFLAYKLLRKEKFELFDIVLLLANSFIFFGIGYSLLYDHKTGAQLLGLFTLCNAIVHFIISSIIYKQQLADKNLFYLVSGLVLVFITIAIPVQLDGNWVTLLWAGEAALLYWIGKTKNVSVYEKLSYPLMLLALFSIMQDWAILYNRYLPENPETRITPLLNVNFLSSLLFIAAFVFINMLHRNKKYPEVAARTALQKEFSRIISVLIPSILLISVYYAFRMEIANYWNQLYKDSALVIKSNAHQYSDYYWNYDLDRFKTIWIINYTLLFVSILSFLNFRKLKNAQLGNVNLLLNILVITVFLTQGLYLLSQLRENYLQQVLAQYYHRTAFNIGIRYISYAFVSLTLFTSWKYIQQDFMRKDIAIPFDLVLHISILWIASSELINCMNIAASTQSYKLGLSILWGLYSLFLIALGIWKKKKHLRIGAIGLFAVTLIKLFLYDISHLNTIAKTIVFVSLGILLLIISFLYNKYKHIITDEIKD